MPMDEHRARQILGDMICSDGLSNCGDALGGNGYLSWHRDDPDACLDAQFTADQLEAIAWWMRHAARGLPPSGKPEQARVIGPEDFPWFGCTGKGRPSCAATECMYGLDASLKPKADTCAFVDQNPLAGAAPLGSAWQPIDYSIELRRLRDALFEYDGAVEHDNAFVSDSNRVIDRARELVRTLDRPIPLPPGPLPGKAEE